MNSKGRKGKEERVNELLVIITREGYSRGLQHVEAEIAELWIILFGSSNHENAKGLIEVDLRNRNYHKGCLLSEAELKDVIADTAKEVWEMFRTHYLDRKKCEEGRGFRFIRRVGRYNYIDAVRKLQSRLIKPLPPDDIKDSPQVNVDDVEFNLWCEFYAALNEDQLWLCVLRVLQDQRGYSLKMISKKMSSRSADTDNKKKWSYEATRKRWNRLQEKHKAFAQEHDLQINFHQIDFHHKQEAVRCMQGAIRKAGRERKIVFPCQCGIDLTYDDVKEKLTRIPQRNREAIVLFYFEGLSAVQCQMRMNVPIGEFRVLIADGLTMLSHIFLEKM